jgi:hypothetical protein
MKIPKTLGLVLGTFVGLAAIAAPAHATDLIIVEQSMLRFVCMFDADCSSSVLPRDVGKLPTAQPGSDPRLQSFSFEAKSGTPADGTTVYVYRVDLPPTDSYGECLTGLVVNFGPPAQMPSAVANAPHMFVITSDGHGTVGVKSAEQEGDFIQFNFDGAVCPGQSTLFFGLPSKNPPVTSSAILFGYGRPPVTDATATAPKHERLAPPGNLRLDTL